MLLRMFADLDVSTEREAQAHGLQEAGDQSPEIVNPPLVWYFKEKNEDPRHQHGSWKGKNGGGQNIEFFGHIVVDGPFFFRIMARMSEDNHSGQKKQE